MGALMSLLHGYLTLKVSLRVERAVVVVLHGDHGEELLALFEGEAVLGEVAGGHHGEAGGRGLRGEAVAPGGHRTGLRKAGVAGVLELLGPDGQHHVVDAGGHGVGGGPDGLRPGGALVLHVGHRDVGQLERRRHDGAGLAGEDAPPPGRLDVLGTYPGILEGLVGRVDDHVLQALAPVLAELDAAHADDGDFVLDALHGLFPRLARPGRAPAGTFHQ